MKISCQYTDPVRVLLIVIVSLVTVSCTNSKGARHKKEGVTQTAVKHLDSLSVYRDCSDLASLWFSLAVQIPFPYKQSPYFTLDGHFSGFQPGNVNLYVKSFSTDPTLPYCYIYIFVSVQCQNSQKMSHIVKKPGM